MRKNKEVIITDSDISLYGWLENNQQIFIDAVYDNIFDFMIKKSNNITILNLVFKTKYIYNTDDNNYIDSYKVVIKLYKDNNMPIIIDTMISFYETKELYERCAAIVELREKYDILKN